MQSNYTIPDELNPALDKLPGAPAVRRRFSASTSNGSSFQENSTIKIFWIHHQKQKKEHLNRIKI